MLILQTITLYENGYSRFRVLRSRFKFNKFLNPFTYILSSGWHTTPIHTTGPCTMRCSHHLHLTGLFSKVIGVTVSNPTTLRLYKMYTWINRYIWNMQCSQVVEKITCTSWDLPHSQWPSELRLNRRALSYLYSSQAFLFILAHNFIRDHVIHISVNMKYFRHEYTI